jgi:hypothetical protein
VRGQALVEFALVAPVLLAFCLVIGEVGMLGVTALRWQGLAQALADAADGDVPAWTAAELARAGCDGPATYVEGDPPRVALSCLYRLRLVNGAAFPASFEAVAREEVMPSPTP